MVYKGFTKNFNMSVSRFTGSEINAIPEKKDRRIHRKQTKIELDCFNCA